VPKADWGLVRAGRKTEFRASPSVCPQLWKVEPPVPVVAYAVFGDRYKKELMVVEEAWREPLGAITEESLRRERQPDLAHFRRYWMARENTAFKPMRMVSVFRVRPWREGDDRAMADRLLELLYGEFLGP
jgi:hypothetical protein